MRKYKNSLKQPNKMNINFVKSAISSLFNKK